MSGDGNDGNDGNEGRGGAGTAGTAANVAATRLRRRQELCAAAARALSGDASLHYRAGRLSRGLRPLPLQAPHLRADTADGLAGQRGAADGVALRLAYSDAAVHRALCPHDPLERLLFEWLEQMRCEALVPPALRGVAANLRARFEDWSRGFHQAGFTDGHAGILLYTVAQIAWSRVQGRPVLEDTEDLIEATRAAIVPALGAALAGLRRHRADQRGYATHALALSRQVGAMLAAAGFGQPAAAEDGKDEDRQAAVRAAFALWLEVDEEAGGWMAVAGGLAAAPGMVHGADAYRVFTTRYDRELQAAQQVRPALLREYRERLDRLLAARGLNLARLARELAAALAQPRPQGWSFGEESGRIDGRRLALLAASPAERRVFRQERLRPRAACAVSLLVDCSGSMKGHVELVAMLVDTLARALELAGVPAEVLGFTTGGWHGGRARQDWLARGRPPRPGRLNERCHLVFQEAARGWRRSRAGIAALFKSDLFREGIDGEALQWACGRLRALDAGGPGARRIVVVISDGSPMDSATALANDAHYLDRHLQQVVAREEARGEIEVLGLGVGLDLSPYYRRSLALDPARPLDTALLGGVVRWLATRGHALPADQAGPAPGVAGASGAAGASTQAAASGEAPAAPEALSVPPSVPR
ncbi:cobalt chelatase [Cupriavidus sp. USMAA2-4]|uniref:cobaltochelatase CobT-related protein n=1 Tax=unclassified Cupriavidus TaxID=2640874 RepID=UPI0008A6AA8B|nr:MULTISPECIES: cobalt chelatase [unclassified Cupriavidus]AOY94584.1 cobalt chelatase [Cupriavidus sp. USMAA2-4]AOZ02565.1 cobalt chelatase [Cupriavidus sp. USMAHM13]